MSFNIKKILKYFVLIPPGILSLLLVFNNKQLQLRVFGKIKYRGFEMKLRCIAVPHESRTYIMMYKQVIDIRTNYFYKLNEIH
ncbi:MAG: hypothetical protein MI975_25455 [Cytophagales bacterium]|nr:hypothetical protein [Cytophagales bacterium]